MKNLLRYLAFVLTVGGAYAQSNLPACPSSGYRHNCFGTFTFSSGEQYVGEYKNDIRNGKGTLTYANGNKYVGDWKDGKRNGQGTFTNAGGEQFVGEWKDDMLNGQGTRYASNGSIINQGIWDGGIFVRSVPVQQASAVNQTVAVAPTQLTGDCSLLFSKGINGNFAYLEVEFPQKKAFAIGVLHTGYQVCQYYNTINYNRNSDDEINKRAISECNKKMPGGTGCVLYATNNEIIYDKESHERQLNQNNSNQQASAVNQTVAVALQPDNSERDRLLAEVEAERKKRQELEEQLKVAQQPTQPNKPPTISGIERRVALVIGNATYKVNPLKNPVNDSTDMSRSLRSVGFEVIEANNTTLAQMREATRRFADKLGNSDVGLVYYSGHGVEVKGKNYLIPVNADIKREYEVVDQAFDASQFLEMMDNIRGPNNKRVNILIVDACRNNELQRNWRSNNNGLARMDAPGGTFISFATAPGRVAADGVGRNSPYTKHLLQALKQPNVPIEQVFKVVRRNVMEETKGEQIPWENSSLVGDFYFTVAR